MSKDLGIARSKTEPPTSVKDVSLASFHGGSRGQMIQMNQGWHSSSYMERIIIDRDQAVTIVGLLKEWVGDYSDQVANELEIAALHEQTKKAEREVIILREAKENLETLREQNRIYKEALEQILPMWYDIHKVGDELHRLAVNALDNASDEGL
jgi:hypothetical protein|tara:strand:+ start:3821 stop:4279 length:459 start_codon:yes stop_codon:yes gene_type:complete